MKKTAIKRAKRRIDAGKLALEMAKQHVGIADVQKACPHTWYCSKHIWSMMMAGYRPLDRTWAVVCNTLGVPLDHFDLKPEPAAAEGPAGPAKQLETLHAKIHGEMKSVSSAPLPVSTTQITEAVSFVVSAYAHDLRRTALNAAADIAAELFKQTALFTAQHLTWPTTPAQEEEARLFAKALLNLAPASRDQLKRDQADLQAKMKDLLEFVPKFDGPSATPAKISPPKAPQASASCESWTTVANGKVVKKPPACGGGKTAPQTAAAQNPAPAAESAPQGQHKSSPPPNPPQAEAPAPAPRSRKGKAAHKAKAVSSPKPSSQAKRRSRKASSSAPSTKKTA